MHNRRCIIFRIFPDQRIFYDRFSQISVFISLSDTLIDRIVEIHTFNVQILADIQKYNSHPRILTDRDLFFFGNFHIFIELAEDLLSQRSLFCLFCTFQPALHVFRQGQVGFNTHVPDTTDNLICMDRSHISSKKLFSSTLYL